MTKLELAKEALLDAIIEKCVDPMIAAQTYDILCQTELNAKALEAQIDGGVFKAHCHHELPPNPFDEEIG